MTDSRRRMERLLLPRARVEPEGVEQPIPEARSPLPRWQTIPLDAKFPVLPAPKGEVTFVTTKMGHSPFKSSQAQQKDFDLSDPYNRTMSLEYKPLFDPYLKGWFARPHVQSQMRKNNLVTERGNVPVSVRDFNQYRLYLRKQALMKGGSSQIAIEEGLRQAQDRKQAVLRKTQMKAEVFGIEVKYKSLKAQQAGLEKEEDKRHQYLQKTQSEEERQRQRTQEEEEEHLKTLRKNQSWARKLDKIKEKDELTRKRAERKLLQFEMEAQDKLNKLDFLREQRFQELDQKRKLKWRMRRLHQMQEMEKAQRQKQSVQAEMRTIKQRYETHMARKAARDEVSLNLIKESRFKLKERDNEAYARRLAQVLKDTRYMTFGPIESGVSGRNRGEMGTFSRQASLWMVQEVLHRLGLTEESLRLKSQGFGNISYLKDLDQAINVAVRRLEGVTVLGEEQEMLSRLVHLVWRNVKTAYPGKAPPVMPGSRAERRKREEEKKAEGEDEEKKAEGEDEEKKVEGEDEEKKAEGEEEEEKAEGEEEEKEKQEQAEEAERKIMTDTLDDALTTGEQLAWYFPDDDDGEEREQAIKISMLITGEMERNLNLPTILGDPRPPDPRFSRYVEERMDEFFKTHMRMTETDALAVEAELFNFLDSLKEGELHPKEMKGILAMCLQLANHDVIKRADPCGELETNPEGHAYLAFEPSEGEGEGEDGSEEWGADGQRKSSVSPTGKSAEGVPGLQAEEEEAGVTRGSEQSEARGPEDETAAAAAAVPADTDDAAAGDGADTDPATADADADAPTDIPGEEDATENATRNRNVNRNNSEDPRSLSSPGSASEGTAEGERVGREAEQRVRPPSRNSDSGGGSFSDAASVRNNDSCHSSKSNSSRSSSSSSSGRSTDHISNSAALTSDLTTTKDKESLGGSDHNYSQSSPARRSDGASNLNVNNELPDEGKSSARNLTQNRMGADADPELTESEAPQEEEEEGEEEGQEEGEGEEEEGEDEQERPSLATEAEDTVLEGESREEKMETRTGESYTFLQNLTDTGDALQRSEETREEMAFEEAVERDDVVAVAEQMLNKIQDREKVKGVSIPQSRLLRFVAMNLSRLWKPGPDDRFHRFGPWLLDPTKPEVIRSLIYNIKRRKFSAELQRDIAKAVVSVCLEGIAQPAMPLTDRLVKVILQRFMADLEKNEVSLAVQEGVLHSVVDAYAEHIHKDPNFNVSVMVLDCMGFVHDLVLSEEVNKKGHLLPAVRNWRSLSVDTKDILECGKWANLLHRASVIIRLEMLTEADRSNLVKLMTSLITDYLGTDTPPSLGEMLEMMRNRMTKPTTKRAFSIDLAVNTVVVLSEILQKSKVSSTTLLPGAQNLSQSACTAYSASVLGPYTTGEALILLMLDKLAFDMAHGAVDHLAQDYMATALVDLLVTQYSYDREELKGEGLVPALDDVIYQLQTQALSFRDVKNLLAAVLRPYVSTRVKPLLRGVQAAAASGRAQGAGEEAPRISLTKPQSSSLMALVTQVFVSFFHGVEARLRRGGVDMGGVARKILSLYTWRAIAGLAKQAKTVLFDLSADYEMESVSSRVKASDSLIIERILHTVVNVEDARGEEESTSQAGSGKENDIYLQFVHAVLDANIAPGFIPVADSAARRELSSRPSFHRKSSTRARQLAHKSSEFEDPQDTPEEKALRMEHTPLHLDRALRQEIIAAAREIGDSLVTTKALRQLTVKTADSFAGVVFVTEKLLDTIYNKFWTLYQGIKRGKIEPGSVLYSLCGPNQCEDLPQLHLSRDAALRVLQEAILELDTQHASTITLSRMVECLSRTAQKLAPTSDPAVEQLRCQPHPILASASPLLLAQWMRACLLAALRAITIVISGGKGSSAMTSALRGDDNKRTGSEFSPKRKKAPMIDPDAILLAASYVVVHNFVSQVRDTVEREKTPDGLWLATNVAGTRESSQIGVPIEILDRVFARLAGIMQTLGERVGENGEESDGRIPERSCDLASTIISQVTSAVSYHVEVGQFPFIRINDLLREAKNPTNAGASGGAQTGSTKPGKAKRKGKGVKENPADTSENARRLNNYSLNNSQLGSQIFPDPVQLMEGRWSRYLFHSLMDVTSRLDMALKEGLEMSVQRHESMTTDARVRARAFTSAMLEKIRKNASSGELLLFSGQDSVQLWRRRQEQPAVPFHAPSAAPSLLSTVASPAVSRKNSLAGVGVRPTATTVNTNVNKTRGQPGRELRKFPSNSTAALGKGVGTRSCSSSLVSYVRNLLRPVCQADSGDIFSGDVSNNKTVDVISELLQAGYSVSLDYLRAFEEPREPKLTKSVSIVIPSQPPQPQARPDVKSMLSRQRHQQQLLLDQCRDGDAGPENADNIFLGSPSATAISVLLLELLLTHLVGTLERKARGVQGMASSVTLAGARTAGRQGGPSPYVSSYLYRTPDPYGRFYAEVVDRGRRWCQMVGLDAPPLETSDSVATMPRMYSLTRDLLASDAKDSNGQPSRDVSGADLTCSTAAVLGTQSVSSQPSSTVHTSQATWGSGYRSVGSSVRRPGAAPGQAHRASTFKKEVRKLSSAYSVDNRNNSWQRRSQSNPAGSVRRRGSISAGGAVRSETGKMTQPARSKLVEPSHSKSKHEPVNPKANKTAVGARHIVTHSSHPETLPEKSGANERSEPQGDRGTIASKRLTCTAPGAEKTMASTNKASRNKSMAASSETRSRLKSALPRSPRARLSLRRSNESESGKTTAEGEGSGHSMKRSGCASFAWTADRKQQLQADRSIQPEAANNTVWQTPTVEVIYHVPKAELAQAEEHLKQFRQAGARASNSAPLSDLDLQLLLLALLSGDLPKETAILAASLRGPARLPLCGLEDVTDLLSLLDHVLADLPVDLLDQAREQDRQRETVDECEGKDKMDAAKKAKVKVRRLLKAAGKSLEVSQRSAGAVHSLLRSLESGMLEDATVAKGILSCTAKVLKTPNLDLDAVKSQLKASLAQLVERLEEGHAPDCMTSSGWARLANEILHQYIHEKPEHSPAPVELQDSSHSIRGDNDLSVENLSDSRCDDDKRSDRYRVDKRSDVGGGGGGGGGGSGDDDEDAQEDYDRPRLQRSNHRPESYSQTSSRSESRSRLSSRSVSRASAAASGVSNTSKRKNAKKDESESEEEPGTVERREDQTAAPSCSSGKLSSASCSSALSASTSSSKSSVSSASSASSSSSCRSAASRRSRKSRASSSVNGAVSKTKGDAGIKSRVQKKKTPKHRPSQSDILSPNLTRVSSKFSGSPSPTNSRAGRKRSRTDSAAHTLHPRRT